VEVLRQDPRLSLINFLTNTHGVANESQYLSGCSQNVGLPEITSKNQDPTDALLRVTTSGSCGSDLHMYDGRTPLEKGTVVGHEIVGVIDEVGEAVQSIKKGDRVVLPFNNCLWISF
jgi:threonine dehydrogenase-like Zn-dependent dehydrogenase